MGKRGPVGKNKALRVLSGKLPITEANLGNVEPLCGPLEAPAAFNEEQRAAWDRTVGMLRGCGLIGNADGIILEAYCTSFVMWQKTEAELRKIEKDKSFLASILIRGAQSAVVINPLVNLNMKLKDETVRYAIQLGMTPQSRQRMEQGAVGVAEKKVNLFKRLKEGRDD